MTPRKVASLSALAVWLAAAPAWAAAEEGLDIFPDARVLALIALFLILIYPSQKLLFVPLLRVLDERRERIEGARAKAERLSRDTDEVLARYESAVQSARGEAEVARRTALETARKNQTRLTAQARAEAEEELLAARATV
ncbi:MAG TPA: ATP synthase F0 subunit B, partial [Planctomycetota bacterium]|nr:ATP synthase F0 subunit B [Planctomycetota bacterium]